jgi:chaperone required for assembly of F1-ATPase
MIAAKRFYTTVSAKPHDHGWCIVLDAKPVRTPAKNMLLVTNETLAQQVAEEWHAQHTTIQPDTMPITRIATIACDLVPTAKADMLVDVLRYGETDLVCYRDSDNAAIAATQAALFDPALQWLADTHAITLNITDALLPIAQPTNAREKLHTLVMAATPEQFAALAMLVPLLGSLVLALALWHGVITAEHAVAASRIEEDAHAERYGMDGELGEKLAAKAHDIRACAAVLRAGI